MSTPSRNFINFRPVAAGNNLPFYRSGSFTLLNERDYQHFHNLQIKYYYDLRSDEEVVEQADAESFNKSSVSRVPLAMDHGGDPFLQLINPAVQDYSLFYVRMLPNAFARLHSMVEHFIADYAKDKNIRVVFGCTMGRDRTGLVAALLLKILGFSDEQILHDYVLSAEHLLKSMDYFIKHHKHESLPDEDYISGARPKEEIMNYVLDHLKQNQKVLDEYSNKPIFAELRKLILNQ